MKRVVILGGGSGGAVAAKRLGRWSKEGEFEVVLIDRSRWHEYRPSYLWVMTGKREPAQVRRSQQVAGLEAPWELDDALAARERLAGRASSVVSWPAESRTTSEPTITGPTGRSSRES